MKEIFTKIWKFLWERTGRKELDSDEIWLLERMDRIAAIEEPDYDRMWERIRRKTICKNSPRVKLWRGALHDGQGALCQAATEPKNPAGLPKQRCHPVYPAWRKD